MRKKGELTSKQLVTIIILIVSFAIILLFIFMLNLRGTIDKETCRNSVITRGALPTGRSMVQLKCKTQDVCLSMGDDCDVYREDMITIKVDNENELMEEMVGLLYDCWWMMGEGKIDYMPATIGSEEAYCSICDKVYFDKKIQESYEDGIPYSKIYEFMQTTKIPSKDETYMFNIYKMNSLDSVASSLMEQENPINIYDYKMNPLKEHVVLTSIAKEGWGKAIGSGIAVATTISSVLLTPITFGWSLIAGSAVGAVAISVGSTIDEVHYIAPLYLEFDGQELQALDCKEYVSEG